MIGDDVANNVGARCVEMDTYVYQMKKESKTYEDFYLKVSNVMMITGPETFKACYWDRNFKKNLIKQAKANLSEFRLGMFNENMRSIR